MSTVYNINLVEASWRSYYSGRMTSWNNASNVLIIKDTIQKLKWTNFRFKITTKWSLELELASLSAIVYSWLLSNYNVHVVNQKHAHSLSCEQIMIESSLNRAVSKKSEAQHGSTQTASFPVGQRRHMTYVLNALLWRYNEWVLPHVINSRYISRK